MRIHTNDAVIDIERTIMQLSWLGQRQFMQLLAGERFDLTVPQYHTLLHVHHCSGMCKMSDLARATHQSAASLTGIVDRLLEKGLVERGRPDDDRRQVVVGSTERGHNLLATIEQARRDAMHKTLAHIPASELNELQRLLGVMLEAMLGALNDSEETASDVPGK
jgi:DNA-binding MarR family transcriptional regulator